MDVVPITGRIVNPYSGNIFVMKMLSTAYIHKYFKLVFIMAANIMNPDLTAPKGAVRSGFILFAI